MKKRFTRLAADFKALPKFDKFFDIFTVVLMVVSVVLQVVLRDDPSMTLQIAANVVATLTLFLTHIVFSERSLLGKLSLKAQKYINLTVILGSFGGQFLYLGGYYSNYDTITHIFTSTFCCLIAYHAYEAVANEPAYKKSSLCASYTFFVSVGISCLWEVFEFCADFITGGGCQYYNYQYNGGEGGKFFYFNRFPFGARPVEQGGLYDTFSDLICACVSAIVTALIIKVFLDRRAAKMKEINK